MSAGLALPAPPLLWAAHFLAVYVFVSLACLWGWHRAAVLGLPLAAAVVAAATFVFAAAVLLCDRAAARRRDFYGRTGAGLALLFAAATLMVGLPALLAPACL
ncbi:hypothetical protein GCM10010964_10160 [Caldovatus sediminis]|uniref:Uncharacterized protein n=1 Tax=Caldovatus sediminis TaxID=2041189 RepID=A0A8J2Z8W3_9PROT|nr:hypothetical protein [Caldovatus sediminis]GGG23970.1 hypothetical protein GCM10010964_10160 [Caldovatus sediminis]